MKSLDRGIAGKRRQRGQRGSAGSGMGRGGRQERFASRPESVENWGPKVKLPMENRKNRLCSLLAFFYHFHLGEKANSEHSSWKQKQYLESQRGGVWNAVAY